MLSRTLLSLILCAVLDCSAGAAASPDESVYFDSGQYSAVFEQTAHHWRLLPLDGHGEGYDVEVTEHAAVCGRGAHIPHGVWVVSRNASGHTQLVAPSTTSLPLGFPEQLELRSCGDRTASANAFLIPNAVLDWIEFNVNSVLIDD
jgi:hypothetical protein